MKRNRRLKRNEPADVRVRLGVTREGSDTLLVIERDADRIRLPLTPSEARLVATTLMTAACQADPQGHIDMLTEMRRENAFATMVPAGGTAH